MSDSAEQFRARAEAERIAGDAATLNNVRERCRRAQAAWEAMAVRAERNQVMRADREAESAERLLVQQG